MSDRQFIVSLIISIFFLFVIVRLVHKGKLDITYCWLWLAIGVAAPFIVLKYDLLIWFSTMIGAVTPTTTLFLFSILILFLMCLQFSIIISKQKRQIKKLVQQIALNGERE
jgi:hypothetical protein